MLLMEMEWNSDRTTKNLPKNHK